MPIKELAVVLVLRPIAGLLKKIFDIQHFVDPASPPPVEAGPNIKNINQSEDQHT